ncbi:3-keto-5-aminohexanoate cleavage protein [bacterium]|nr:3-keto-5-aminohexanoate cleavage protein [bacterium]
MEDKVIITAALSGGQVMKENNPSVPYTPEEFVREAKCAEEAGAAIAHVHFREYDTGNPTTEPKYMVPIYQALKESTNLIINTSTGISLETPLKERLRPVTVLKPEMASLNPGAMNFCIVSQTSGKIYQDWIFHNPFHATVEFGQNMKEVNCKPELEVFGIAHIHNTLWFRDRFDFLVDPLHYSFVFGVMGGITFNSDTINSCIHAIPAGSTWQGIGVGPLSFPVAMACAIHGGHIRVGLEDNIYIDQRTKTLAKGNWDQVEKAVQIAHTVGRDPTTPKEAREILHIAERA